MATTKEMKLPVVACPHNRVPHQINSNEYANNNIARSIARAKREVGSTLGFSRKLRRAVDGNDPYLLTQMGQRERTPRRQKPV